MEQSVKANRFYMIDTLRGVMIIGVVIMHFLYDLYIYDVAWVPRVMDNIVVKTTVTFGQIMFIFISGICSRLSRNNIKRSLWVIGAAAMISGATYALDIIMYGEVGHMFIYFGILHLLGFCMLIYGLTELVFLRIKIGKKQLYIISLAMCLILLCMFALLFNFKESKLSSGSLLNGTLIGKIIGFDGYEIISADYFPLLPWAIVFFAGAFLGIFFKEDKVPQFLHGDICPPITFIGRNTLLIYLLHQPVIYGIVYLVAK